MSYSVLGLACKAIPLSLEPRQRFKLCSCWCICPVEGFLPLMWKRAMQKNSRDTNLPCVDEDDPPWRRSTLTSVVASERAAPISISVPIYPGAPFQLVIIIIIIIFFFFILRSGPCAGCASLAVFFRPFSPSSQQEGRMCELRIEWDQKVWGAQAKDCEHHCQLEQPGLCGYVVIG